jgi:heme-degrading monooxygenase HmoA
MDKNREHWMIICSIEFAVRPGAEAMRDALVAELMKAVVLIDGFISKETLISRDRPGQFVTVSCWRDEDSLRLWMRDPAHLRTMAAGKQSVFTRYRIQLATVTKDIAWTAPDAQAPA